MTLSHRAYIALGANLGKPVEQFCEALALLNQTEGVEVVSTSSLYRTAPVGLVDQPDFINAVAAVSTQLSARDLLDKLLDVEQNLGRVRNEKNGPRTLDLDLLLYDDLVIHDANLTLPHPRMHLRAFVLYPLAEIAPELRIPSRGSVRAWTPAVALQNITRHKAGKNFLEWASD